MMPTTPILVFGTCLVTCGMLCAAPLTESGQKAVDAISAVNGSIRDLTKILESVTDKESADAAARPMRKKTQELYINLRKINELELPEAPSEDDDLQINKLITDMQILQATFERHCMRIANNRFYDSIPLARVFHAIATVYQRQEEMQRQKLEQEKAQNTPPPAQQ